MSLSLTNVAVLQTPFAFGTVAVVGNGPYIIEQATLCTPGQQAENIWPVGTDRQLLFTPGSFQINVTR